MAPLQGLGELMEATLGARVSQVVFQIDFGFGTAHLAVEKLNAWICWIEAFQFF